MNRILFFLVASLCLPVLLFAQTYDFTGETPGDFPANVSLGNNGSTTNDGDAEVTVYSSDNTMEVTAVGSANTCVLDMDLYTSDNDYSVVWKETYSTDRRAGFILRANGVSTGGSLLGLKQGYLFQVNGNVGGSSSNTLRLYRVDASAFTLIVSVSLSAPGSGVARWYRATVDGNSLTFDYSTDGSSWTNMISETDNTHSSGSVQYTMGYGKGAGELYVDDITKGVITYGSFTLSESALDVNEGSTGTFTAVLDIQPSTDVVIDFTSDNTNKATVSPASLTFTDSNWDTPQTLTVSGIDDAVACNSTAVITGSVNDALSDDDFDGAPDQSVDITVINNDALSVVYNFEGDTPGNPPSNITADNGSSEVVAGNAMAILSASSGYTAVFTFDLISSSLDDYTVSWKENYSTAGRSGLIMRGTGSNTSNPGAMQGYLIQVSPNYNHARIYISGPTSYTQLVETILTAPGTGVDRWYRATVEGSLLTFEYSDDGTNYTIVHTISDNTYPTAGETQFVRGYGATVSGLNIDDISFFGSGGISVNNIVEYQIFQRDGSDQANISISGSYSGTPTAIEASFNGSSYSTIDASPSGGTFSGTLINQAAGQGTLTVRFTNDNGVSDDINNVGIGDIFIIAGQSNASGRGNTTNSYSHASLKATLFGNDDNWKDLTDPTDDNTNQVDGVSSDSNAAGSPWPLIATNIMTDEDVPVAFVPTSKGGTSISAWQPGADHSDASTLYGSMNRRITAVGGSARAILFFQGETDASSGTSEASYISDLNTFINTVNSDFPGLQTMVGQIGESTFAGKDAVRAAQINVSHANANAILGPVTYDIDLTVDNLHFKTDTEIQEFSRRWYLAIDKAFYGGSNGYGPIADDIGYDGTKVTVSFTDDTSPVIDPASTVTASTFILENNGSPVTISGVVINGSTVEITPASALNILQSITLTYASSNDGVGAAVYDDDDLPAENFYDEEVRLNIIWDGSESTDWNDPDNWSGGIVPNSSYDVVIPDAATVPNSPVISNGQTGTCKDLTLESGASLTCNGDLTHAGP